MSCRAQSSPRENSAFGKETSDPPKAFLKPSMHRAHISYQYGRSGADLYGGRRLTVTSPFTRQSPFLLLTCMDTHTERQRPWGGGVVRGNAKSPSPCRGSLWGLAGHYGKIRPWSARLSDVIVGFTLYLVWHVERMAGTFF